MKGVLAIGLGVVILIIAGISLFSLNRAVVGSPAPAFKLPLHKNYSADLPGVARLGDLEAQYHAYIDRGVVFIGVDCLDTEKAAAQYLREFDITYLNGIDIHEKIAKAYRITGVPETFIVDQEDVIRHV